MSVPAARRGAPVLLAALLCACVRTYAPAPRQVTEESLTDAALVILRSIDTVRVVEDGLAVQGHVYVTVVREDFSPFPESALDDPRKRVWTLREERVLRGPVSFYLPYTSIRAVSVRSWPLWAGVELEVDPIESADAEPPRRGPLRPGEVRISHSPVVIRAQSDEEARRLADAIDLVRRAHAASDVPPLDATDSSEIAR